MNDDVQKEFLSIMSRYQSEGTVFQSPVQQHRYCIASVDSTGCDVKRLDANEPARVSISTYETCLQKVRVNGGSYAFNQVVDTVAIRTTVLQGLHFGLTPDKQTILDLITEEKASAAFRDLIQNLRIDETHGQPKLYKPAMLACVIEALESGEISQNRIEFDWILPRFIQKTKTLGIEVTAEQAALPFFHLTSDLFWMLCYKNTSSILEAGNARPSAIRERVSHAIIKDTFWRILENSDGRKKILKALEEKWWPVGPPKSVSSVIRDGLENVLSKYAIARANEKFGTLHELWSIFGGLRQALATSDAVKKRPKLKVTWSVGQANWAKVPWIAFLDERETNTTQRGVYCVFLFRQDMSGVYLTFNQGVTEPKQQYGPKKGKSVLRSRAEELRKHCNDLVQYGFALDDKVDLRADSGLGSDYEDSTVAYKLYETNKVPDDAVILNDLDAVLKSYDTYLKQPPSTNRSWIFQANPKFYDLEKALESLKELTFEINQHKNDIHAGDKVFLWQSGTDAGIVAVARVTTEPKIIAMPDVEKQFAKVPDRFSKDTERAYLKVERLLVQPILREDLLAQPDLSELTILKAPQGSNFSLTPEQAAAIEALIDPAPALSDLGAIHDAFSKALRASNISFGSRHDEVVRSFLASLATKRFVILTGLSGSGKTQIAIKLGEWLGNGRFLVVPVRPDWTGSESLFGYEDALQPCSEDGRKAWYVPDVLRFILQAAKDSQNPYLLVLDEMNLAHVERYFADMLSGMESMQSFLPNLILQNGTWRIHPSEEPKLPYPRNLFIVGTVNVDETTYMFSPKVLDRANTLEFRVETSDLSADARKPKPCSSGEASLVRGFRGIAEDDAWHLEHPATHLDTFLEHLRTLHHLLSEGGFEFGHRVFYEAVRFASMLEAAGDSKPEHALDLQVMQKVLPRLHGSRKRLEPTLCGLGQYCFDLTFGPASKGTSAAEQFNPLAPPQGGPKLPISFDKIQRMTRSLRANQFVSFTE
jgi:hypothetical protein